MKKVKKVTIVDLDYWAAVYFDGKKVSEGDPHSAEDILKLLEVDVETIWGDGDWFQDETNGEFPDNLEDIKQL
jgi:hypothetical protein